MKNFYRIITIALILSMLFTMTACGINTTDETTVPVTTTTTDETTSVEYTPSDPEYYRDEYSETAAQFWAKSSKLGTWRDATLEEFSKNPIITQTFLAEMEEMNSLYEEIYMIPVETRMGQHPDVTLQEYLIMDAEATLGYLVEPMQVLSYDDIWADLSMNPVYDNGNWGQEYSSRYAEGLFELDEGYYVTVEWMENFTQVEGSDDFGYRAYQVVDPTRDAFLLIYGEETAYRLVCIKATE